MRERLRVATGRPRLPWILAVDDRGIPPRPSFALLVSGLMHIRGLARAGESTSPTRSEPSFSKLTAHCRAAAPRLTLRAGAESAARSPIRSDQHSTSAAEHAALGNLWRSLSHELLPARHTQKVPSPSSDACVLVPICAGEDVDLGREARHLTGLHRCTFHCWPSSEAVASGYR